MMLMVSSHLVQVSEVPCALRLCACLLLRSCVTCGPVSSPQSYRAALPASCLLTCVTCCILYTCHFIHAAEIAVHHVRPCQAASSFRMLPGDPHLSHAPGLTWRSLRCAALQCGRTVVLLLKDTCVVCRDLAQLALGEGLLAHTACHILSLALSKARCTDLLVRSLSGDWQLWLPQGVSCEQLCCVNSGVILWGRCLEV